MAPLTASTNTTRPTSDTTYLANRPPRRNQILSFPIIQTLVRPPSPEVCAHSGLFSTVWAPRPAVCPAWLARSRWQDQRPGHLVERGLLHPSPLRGGVGGGGAAAAVGLKSVAARSRW